MGPRWEAAGPKQKQNLHAGCVLHLKMPPDLSVQGDPPPPVTCLSGGDQPRGRKVGGKLETSRFLSFLLPMGEDYVPFGSGKGAESAQTKQKVRVGGKTPERFRTFSPAPQCRAQLSEPHTRRPATVSPPSFDISHVCTTY